MDIYRHLDYFQRPAQTGLLIASESAFLQRLPNGGRRELVSDFQTHILVKLRYHSPRRPFKECFFKWEIVDGRYQQLLWMELFQSPVSKAWDSCFAFIFSVVEGSISELLCVATKNCLHPTTLSLMAGWNVFFFFILIDSMFLLKLSRFNPSCQLLISPRCKWSYRQARILEQSNSDFTFCRPTLNPTSRASVGGGGFE